MTTGRKKQIRRTGKNHKSPAIYSAPVVKGPDFCPPVLSTGATNEQMLEAMREVAIRQLLPQAFQQLNDAMLLDMKDPANRRSILTATDQVLKLTGINQKPTVDARSIDITNLSSTQILDMIKSVEKSTTIEDLSQST